MDDPISILILLCLNCVTIPDGAQGFFKEHHRCLSLRSLVHCSAETANYQYLVRTGVFAAPVIIDVANRNGVK
jgi:hypothetical protein